MCLQVCSAWLEPRKYGGSCLQCCSFDSLNYWTYFHSGSSVYMIALIKNKKKKHSTQKIYQTNSLSYHYSLITITERNIEWMSVIHCLLNWLQRTSSRLQPDRYVQCCSCQHPVSFPAALRSWLVGCQIPGRCPSVVAHCQLPFNPIGCDIACQICSL